MGAKLETSAALAIDRVRGVAKTVQNDEHEFAWLHRKGTFKKLSDHMKFNESVQISVVATVWTVGDRLTGHQEFQNRNGFYAPEWEKTS
jgi:hypothetical protein